MVTGLDGHAISQPSASTTCREHTPPIMCPLVCAAPKPNEYRGYRASMSRQVVYYATLGGSKPKGGPNDKEGEGARGMGGPVMCNYRCSSQFWYTGNSGCRRWLRVVAKKDQKKVLTGIGGGGNVWGNRMRKLLA